MEALSNQVDAPEFEVVVVLNRCSDDSRTIAESFAHDLRLVMLEANDLASASYTRNRGAEAAASSVLLFCDADDRVETRWVAEMERALRRGDADFVGGRIVVDRKDLPDWLYELHYRAFDGRCTQTARGLPYAMSASLGCRRAAFDAVGGFDEAFPGAGSEEVDLAARLLRAGFRIGEAPSARLNYRPRTTTRDILRQVRSYARGWVVLAAKEGLLKPPPANRLAVCGRTTKRIAHLIIRQRELRPRVVLFHTVRIFSRLEAERQQAIAAASKLE